MPQAVETLTPIEMPAVQTRLSAEEEQALLRVLREANTLATGPEAEAFEREFTAFIGCADAVCVSSCSSALELAATLTGLKPEDEVILPAHTFVATAVPFLRTGASLKWADIDFPTRVISAETIEPLITPATKVIVVVHLYGLAAEMNPIMALAEQHGIQVVEDCAQAPGARCQGRRVGSIGHFGCFSFHTHKNMTTLGEGGMLTVRDARHAVQARRCRWMGNWPFEGERDRYWVPAMGDLVEPVPGRLPANYCMGEPNCAVGRLLLKRLDAINQERREQAERFQRGLREYPELQFQAHPAHCEHVYHLMSAYFDGARFGKTRDDLVGRLFNTYKVKPLVHYWPLYRAELFRSRGLGEAHVPLTDRFFDSSFGFPWFSAMGNDLIDDMADRTCRALDDLRSG